MVCINCYGLLGLVEPSTCLWVTRVYEIYRVCMGYRVCMDDTVFAGYNGLYRLIGFVAS